LIQTEEILVLPEGNFSTSVLKFEEKDRSVLFDIYKAWRKLSADLIDMSARAINLPEGLSEGAFCLEMGFVRVTNSISGANTSWDCYDLINKERIQVKACSVLPDLTSFGPKSQWDKIYFLDFYRKGKWDGTFDIYLIDNEDIYNQKVNQNQSLKQQQEQGKRPRFSIFSSIIQSKDLSPVKTAYLNKSHY